MTRLADLATVFRSKNAEPFLTTIDIFFGVSENYERVKLSGALNVGSVADAYQVPRRAVFGVYWVDSLKAVKVTLYKYAHGEFTGQGDPALADMFGAQQHIPLLDLEVSDGVA